MEPFARFCFRQPNRHRVRALRDRSGTVGGAVLDGFPDSARSSITLLVTSLRVRGQLSEKGENFGRQCAGSNGIGIGYKFDVVLDRACPEGNQIQKQDSS
jgi:hypothetical protein